ncbi:hypothetical protein QLQ12_36565 [Actinoplanes sp. NEAU-A12]|uniref:Uncharacterized protein n=1 Tax=Actinoplanes sandaracinus TaxID=3045177 RepID=A0ABT6WWX2_9ACTN|nr:hypothetical protein [Actinoplanes sandaracinus]MDI6104120.1 hypothetical protein [Actinoplanes sandaracinus]
MTNRSPLAPKVLKGAFIRLDVTGIGPVPQVIGFQYNPESLTRKLKPYEQPPDKEADPLNPAARVAPYDPEEEMDVVIAFDAIDDLEEPALHPQTVLTGVADRIAALEMLMYPTITPGLLTSAVGAIAGALGAATDTVPDKAELPVVLFAWGPGRILPVKISSFTVEEQAFNSALYPIRAKVTVGIRVLTEDYFRSKLAKETDPLPPAESIACAAYRAATTQKKVLAATSVASGVASLLATLPF